MILSDSQYDTIVREYGRQQTENHHKLEERRREIYARLPVVRQLETEIAERSVTCTKKLLEGNKGVLDRLKEDLRDLREQGALTIRTASCPDDYLELHYRCPDCRDTGFVGSRKRHYFLQIQMELLHVQPNLEDVLERENFKALSYEYYDDTEILPQLGITNTAYMRRVAAGCKAFVRDSDKKHDNFLSTGSTGVGKTFLTDCIAREPADDFHSVIYLIASNLLGVLSRNKFDYDNAEDIKNMYWFILDCDLLIISDLGVELNSSSTSSQLFYCINEWMDMSRSTITSTNLTLTRLRDSYIDYVTSRIMSGHRVTLLYGGDIRLLKK